MEKMRLQSLAELCTPKASAFSQNALANCRTDQFAQFLGELQQCALRRVACILREDAEGGAMRLALRDIVRDRPLAARDGQPSLQVRGPEEQQLLLDRIDQRKLVAEHEIRQHGPLILGERVAEPVGDGNLPGPHDVVRQGGEGVAVFGHGRSSKGDDVGSLGAARRSGSHGLFARFGSTLYPASPTR
jgi:hypothetical protein